MRVLLVIDSLGSGGAQNQLTLLAKGLKGKGYEVDVFTYYPMSFFSSRIERLNIRHIYKKKRRKLGVNIIFHLAKMYSAEKYHTVISFLQTPNLYVSLAKRISRHKPSVIVSYRSMSDFSKLSKFSLGLKKWVNKTADHITTNSFHERERWVKRFGNGEKWSVIYNAVDSMEFPPQRIEHKAEVAGKFLVVGSVGPAKNGLLLISALKILQERNLKVHIVWVGQKVRNIENRRQYVEAMEKEIANSRLTDCWTWLPPSNDIAQFYVNCEALILASNREGLPNVVCEALTCGLPCIVSDTLDHPRLITDGETGFLFQLDSPKTLADKISDFLNLSSERRMVMKRSACKKSTQMFNEERFINQYENLINPIT